ncbi:MAG TPA: hypothetical protein VLI67_10810 [Vicinamibacteria bacterium]|nr:hypothetical protein [Vicinamibacteria bacterium]
MRFLSGTAFTIQDQNSDPDQNGILFDPLPAGTYSGTGSDAITVDNAGGRNGAYGPSFFTARTSASAGPGRDHGACP